MLFLIILFLEDLWIEIQVWLGRIFAASCIFCLLHIREVQQLIASLSDQANKTATNTSHSNVTATTTSSAALARNNDSSTNETNGSNMSNNYRRLKQQEYDNAKESNEEEHEKQPEELTTGDDNDDFIPNDYGLEDDNTDEMLDLGLENDNDDDDDDDGGGGDDDDDENKANEEEVVETPGSGGTNTNNDNIASNEVIGEETRQQQEHVQQQQLQRQIQHQQQPQVAIIPKYESRQEQVKNSIKRVKDRQRQTKLQKKQNQQDMEEKMQHVTSLFTTTTTNEHPGLDQFHHWYQTEASLFRNYTLFPKSDNSNSAGDHIPTYPLVRSKHTTDMDNDDQIELRIGNTLLFAVVIYWLDHYGKASYKGMIEPYHTWQHTTYLNHPFIICRIDHIDHINDIEQQTKMVYYIPYRKIPSVSPEALTITNQDEGNVSLHQFVLVPPPPSTSSATLSLSDQQQQQQQHEYYCWIQDPILPFSSKETFITPRDAIGFTLLHCYRMEYPYWVTVMKYITKIVTHANDDHHILYRMIRISNPVFSQQIWNYTCVRGIFYAAGFIENYQGHLQIGTSDRRHGITRQYIQDLSQLLLALELWYKRSR